ncbi:MAG: RusA family crossover junction endodeoxyribonuclease [Planctomycetes bacterium]|jgi:Holliday junction resolvase RusA-like endonuclease|nr:RusA family crossover junction endodeoxyribonuclease [Planctomycetota bacterium]
MKKVFKFVIEGRPKVQKNDLIIRRGKKNRPFVGHSKKLGTVREFISEEAYKQYIEQGGLEPIDYLCEIRFVFYCPKQAEPDLDNLPSIVLDALQGEGKKGNKGNKNQVLVDDKLVRLERSEKIVKGDKKYHGEPRTEFEIRKYNG